MKIYDRVKLINERYEYTKAGVKINDTGIIMGKNRNGYLLVYFDGISFLDNDGVYKTTEIDLSVKPEDLEIIENKIKL